MRVKCERERREAAVNKMQQPAALLREPRLDGFVDSDCALICHQLRVATKRGEGKGKGEQVGISSLPVR